MRSANARAIPNPGGRVQGNSVSPQHHYTVQELQLILQSSNFHNYTVGKPFNDRTVRRFMMSLEVQDPVVVGEIEWISVKIHGQSFMLHQIVSGSVT